LRFHCFLSLFFFHRKGFPRFIDHKVFNSSRQLSSSELARPPQTEKALKDNSTTTRIHFFLKLPEYILITLGHHQGLHSCDDWWGASKQPRRKRRAAGDPSLEQFRASALPVDSWRSSSLVLQLFHKSFPLSCLDPGCTSVSISPTSWQSSVRYTSLA
jgi:hypothetical protein